MQEYIVRADFFPDGSIVPLGITDEKGYSYFVDKIVQVHYRSNSSIEIQCIIDNVKRVLIFEDNRWVIQ